VLRADPLDLRLRRSPVLRESMPMRTLPPVTTTASGDAGAGDRASSAGLGAATWPMPVRAFLDGPYLEPTDILLMRERRSLFAWLVSIFTGGFFSKAALVFLVPHREADFARAFVIEAGFRGVDLTEAESFLDYSTRRFDVAVRRLERPWFTDAERNRVRGLMLVYIKARYDFGRLFQNLLVALDRSGFVLLRLFLGPRRAFVRMVNAKRRRSLNRFIGTGFIQWSFREAIAEEVEAGRVPAAALDHVVFSEALRPQSPTEAPPRIDTDDLLSVTADDLAGSTQLVWKYAIINGLAYQVSSNEEFRALVREARKRRRPATAAKPPAGRPS
jgi:hypothetical protein